MNADVQPSTPAVNGQPALLTDHALLATQYDRDGFVLPIDVISADQARELRNSLEQAEASVAAVTGAARR